MSKYTLHNMSSIQFVHHVMLCISEHKPKPSRNSIMISHIRIWALFKHCWNSLSLILTWFITITEQWHFMSYFPQHSFRIPLDYGVKNNYNKIWIKKSILNIYGATLILIRLRDRFYPLFANNYKSYSINVRKDVEC